MTHVMFGTRKVVEASELSHKRICRDDNSIEFEGERYYYHHGVRDDEGEVLSWRYASADGKRTLIVLND